MNVGDELLLDISIVPEEADNKEFVVESSNIDIVSVSENKIKAVASGDAVIQVSSKDKSVTNLFKVSVIDVKVENDFNDDTIKNSMPSTVERMDNSDDSGAGAVVALGVCGVGGYALYKRKKSKK